MKFLSQGCNGIVDEIVFMLRESNFEKLKTWIYIVTARYGIYLWTAMFYTLLYTLYKIVVYTNLKLTKNVKVQATFKVQIRKHNTIPNPYQVLFTQSYYVKKQNLAQLKYVRTKYNNVQL